MTEYSKEYYSKYTVIELFDIVSDVAKYPEFLPWVVAARIDEISSCELEAELAIKFKAIRSKYTSRVIFQRPKDDKSSAKITVSLIKGPFRYLTNEWVFEPAKSKDSASGATKVSFHIDFAFQSRMFENVIGKMFEKSVIKMSNAFELRAKELFRG